MVVLLKLMDMFIIKLKSSVKWWNYLSSELKMNVTQGAVI